MAWINKFNFGLINAYAMRQRNGGGEYAVFMRRGGALIDAPWIDMVTSHPNGLQAWSTHTAIVNGIQGLASQSINLGNLIVFVTYTPTIACLSIMKTHGLHSVSYLDGNGQICYIRTNDRQIPNINQLLIANLPTGNPDRINAPAGLLPSDQLLQNPALPGGINDNALLYLNEVYNNNHQNFTNWHNTFIVPRQAQYRQIASLNQILGSPGRIASHGYTDAVYMLFVYAIAGRIAPPVHQGSRIVAVLGDLNGNIYGWQVNQRGHNTTYHAETNLIQAYRERIPAGATLYSTLEPCHQCAGLFVKAGGQRCVYGQNDPNMTGNTALNGMSSRFDRATFIAGEMGDRPIRVGAQLDLIRDQSRVAFQAAAVGREVILNVDHNGDIDLQGHLHNAQQDPNLHLERINRRVLDILDAPPSMEVFHQSERVLRNLIQINQQEGPTNAVINSIAQIL